MSKTRMPSSSDKFIKEGLLYKKRDHIKGWRARRFTLDDHFLHYYLEGSCNPRGSIQLASGVTITSGPSKIVNGVEYFLIDILHPESSKLYKLSATSKAECGAWINAMNEVVKQNQHSYESILETNKVSAHLSSIGNELKCDESLVETSVISTISNIQNENATLRNIPLRFRVRVEETVQVLMKESSPDAAGWVSVFDKSGVKGCRKPGGACMFMRGELFMPYSVGEIYEVVSLNSNRKLIDAQVDRYTRDNWFAHNTAVEHILYKPVWPTAARDFVNITHWRLFNDGSLITLGYGEEVHELFPPLDGVVRGNLIAGGYVFRPTEGGTQVFILVQSDLGGSVPSAVANFVAQSQPMVLLTLLKLVEDKFKSSARQVSMKPLVYSDIISIIEKNNPSQKFQFVLREDLKSLKANKLIVSCSSDIKKKDDVTTDTSQSLRSNINSSSNKSNFYLNLSHLIYLSIPMVIFILWPTSTFRGFVMKIISCLLPLLYVFDLIVVDYIGKPRNKLQYWHHRRVPDVCQVYRCQINLKTLLTYVDMYRNIVNNENITIPIIVGKATSQVLNEMPQLHGYVINGAFYTGGRNVGNDISISSEIADNIYPSSKHSVMIKISNTNTKSINAITQEVASSSQRMKETRSVFSSLLSTLPVSIALGVVDVLHVLSGKYGLYIPILGLEGFPHGLAAITSQPTSDTQLFDNVVNTTMMPSTRDSASPIVVSVGGVSIQHSLRPQLSGTSQRQLLVDVLDDGNVKSVSHIPVLNIAVAISNCAASLTDGQLFVSKLESLLNNPHSIESFDNIEH